MPDPHVAVTVWGDYALFSRPDFKVERVSYPVITPSAARGVLEAIFWKPEFRYRIRRIEVVEPGAQVSVLRNEITKRQGASPVVIEKERTQRTALMLRGAAPDRPIRYVLHADLALRPHATDPLPKYVCQFDRHVKRGSCFHRPYLGTRECAASFGPVAESDRPAENFNLDIGPMLLDVAFVPEGREDFSFRRQDGDGKRVVKGHARPVFFPAAVKAGVLDVPQHHYDQIEALERHAA